jgi:TfoX/Sxy family transcriptional regulator of competence genes
MADWDELVERKAGGRVKAGSMFGSPGLRTGTKFFAVWWRGQLVLKLPAEQRAHLITAGVARQFEPMAGRPMNGWVVVAKSADRAALVDDAQDFVESLKTSPVTP